MITAADAMTLNEAIAAHRSTRRYLTDDVNEAQIRELLAAAVRAPTALHAEPWRFVIVQDRGALRRYSDRAKEFLLKQADALREVYDTAEAPEAGSFARMLLEPDYNVFYNAGTLISICGRLTNPFGAADCWLAAQNLMLKATALGLGTCCIGLALAVLNSPDVKTELKIPEDHTTVVAIIVGHSAEAPREGSRKPPIILSWISDTARSPNTAEVR